MTTVDDLEHGFEDITAPIDFVTPADPMPGDLRLPWRLATLLLVLARCRANTANLQQLNLLHWAIRSPKHQRLIVRWFQEDKRPDDSVVRFDPALVRTVNLAVAIGLVTRTSTLRFSLTSMGVRYAASLNEHDDVLTAETQFLNALPRRITQKQISHLLERY